MKQRRLTTSINQPKTRGARNFKILLFILAVSTLPLAFGILTFEKRKISDNERSPRKLQLFESFESEATRSSHLSWSKITLNDQVDAVRMKMMKHTPSGGNSSSSRSLRKLLAPYVRYMSERMIRPLTVWGEQHYALSETVFPLAGDWWYWTDDNAKTLEMFALPGIYEAFQESADHLIRFVMALMRSEFVFRRVAGIPADQNANGIVIESRTWLDWRLHNGLMDYRSSGNGNILHQAFRFHDGRSISYTSAQRPILQIVFRENSTLHCPTTQFKVEGYLRWLRVHGWQVFEKRKNNCVVLLEPSKATLRAHQEGPIRNTSNTSVAYTFETDYNSFSNELASPTAQRILTAEFSFEVSSQSTRAITSVNFTNISPEVEDLKVGFVNQHLGAWSFFCGSYQGQLDCVKKPLRPGRKRFLTKHPVTGKGPEWYSILQSSAQGFSYGLHKFVMDPDQFFQMGSTENDPKQIQLSLVLYRCKNIGSGSCFVQEDQILTAGGFYSTMDLYQDLFTSGAATQDGLGLIDFSISYDIGAELNGLATHYAFAAKRQYSKNVGVSLTELKSVIDRHTKRYWKSFGMKRIENFLGDPAFPEYPNLFTRGVGFMLLASSTMYAVTQEGLYLDSIYQSIEALKFFRTKTHQFRCFGGQLGVFHDCHAAVLLGIARVLTLFDREFYDIGIDETLLLEMLNGGWQSYTVVQRVLPCCPKFGYMSVLKLTDPSDGRDWGNDIVDWNFKSGILLRAVHATSHLPNRYFSRLRGQTLQKMTLIKRYAETFLWNSTRVYKKESIKGDKNRSSAEDDEDETLMLEIKTSLESGETNTETQPWAVLGLHGSAVEGLYKTKSGEWLQEHSWSFFQWFWYKVKQFWSS